MKTEDKVEVTMRDGSKVIGKFVKKRQTGIIIKKDEYYAFSPEKTISVEIYIPYSDVKDIKKKNLIF